METKKKILIMEWNEKKSIHVISVLNKENDKGRLKKNQNVSK